MAQERQEPSWSEWGRYTLSAVAGALVAAVAMTLWLSGVSAAAHGAEVVNEKQADQLERLGEISNDLKVVLSRVVAMQEAQDSRIKALEARSGR